MSGETVRKWAGINKNTIVDWFNFCREVCAIYMDQIDIYREDWRGWKSGGD